MANFQHLKASRTQILDTFPVKSFGNDGDIVISRVSGRGVFVCIKAGGIWYAANQMQELGRVGKSTVKELTASKLTIQNIVNTQTNIDNYAVSDLGNIKYKTGKQVVNDLPLPFKNISYKSAYCSLEQYSDKETCEANGGTWYYSENDTHDSISSTAENQLLTIGQMHNSVDAEPTLLYDGSVLEIKRNTNFDDNWQTATVNSVLKLSYSPTVSSQLGTDSNGYLRITASNTVLSGTLEISTIAEVGSDTDKFLMSDSGVVKFVTGANLRSYIGAGTGDGDITGVSITTDTGAGSKAEDTAGSADFSILGSNGVGVTNSGTTITAVAVPAEIDHDSLNNFDANEHFTQANITTVGTIGTGVWQGTAIAHAYIGADAIEGDNIADDAVNSEHYTDGSIDTAHIADDQVTYAKIQNMTDARMLGNNAGSDGVITEMTKANVLTFLNVADGAGVAPTNYVTNDADDTMVGTLTIDKNSTATTTANTYGALVDFDHTGICAGGQTINNRAFTTVLNTNSPTHVGTLNNFGIVNSVVSGTSGTQNNYGIYNTVVSGDSQIGIYQNVSDGGTDLKLVSSANTGDYFTLATTANGATALATVDADGTSANFTADIGGSLTIEAATTVGIEAEGSDLTLTSARDTNVDSGRYIGLDANSAIWYFNKAGSTIAMVKESSFNLKESADAVADTAGYGQLWVHDDTPNNLYFTDDTGQDIAITNNGSVNAPKAKTYLDWYYYFASLSSNDTFYVALHHDEFGVTNSLNTNISDYNDTTAEDMWRVLRYAGRRIPYTGDVTKFMVSVESTGASADSDVEVGVWVASKPTLDSELASTTNMTIDNLGYMTFDFSSASRFLHKELTSFNATSVNQGDFMFVTVKKTVGTDGTSFNIHSTVTMDID